MGTAFPGMSRIAFAPHPFLRAFAAGSLWAACAAWAAAPQGEGAAAGVPAVPGLQAPSSASQNDEVAGWIGRLNQDRRKGSYSGTFAMSSVSGGMTSGRIWHVCDGDRQVVERIESLTGAPRSTFRRNDQVVTFLPDQRVARIERREAIGVFPHMARIGAPAIAGRYAVQRLGSERVAGHEADVVHFQPRDPLRFGYRVWSERRTGLAVMMQTLDGGGRVLEQAAFSALDLDTPVATEPLLRAMENTTGYRLERVPEASRTTPAREGWSLQAPVDGFETVNCLLRPAPPSAPAPAAPSSGAAERTSAGKPVPASDPPSASQPASGPRQGGLQWTLSDGLATVSLFLEPFDPQRHGAPAQGTMGATHTLARRVAGDWWLTAVGEVPFGTLRIFADRLERRP
jgi:sigma-E factor negative regulatory protein RseB